MSAAGLCAAALALGQLQGPGLLEFNARRQQANQVAMATLTAWAAASVLSGGAGWLLADDREARGFHQGNVAFGLVNGALGTIGLVNGYADPSKVDLQAAVARSQSDQLFYLVNAGLDLVYLGTGALLGWLGAKRGWPLVRGWGQAFLLQAAFLLVFDLALVALNHAQDAPLRAGPGRP